MPRAKKTEPTPPPPAEDGASGEVFSLAEAAAYLRLPEADVIEAVGSQELPGRRVGGQWRFHRDAVRDWLSTGSPTPEMRKAAQLALAGKYKDDPEMIRLQERTGRRGRSSSEVG